MVTISLKRTLGAAGLSAGLIFTATATPAMANASSTAVDMSMPIAEAQENTLTDSDAQFRELFSKWEALDSVRNPTTFALPDTPVNQSLSVSVPSRMPLNNSRMSSGYGMRTHPVVGGRRRHNGIDLAAARGTPIYATADGVVSRANRFGSYGLYIAIEHGGEIQTRYAHLSRISVRSGDRINKGELIGYVGSTGRSTGPHLHYEVRIAGKSVNPMPYMVESKAQNAYALVRGEGGRGGQ